MTTIATLPLLTDSERDLAREGRKVPAMLAYRARVRIDLGGVPHRPTLRGARAAVDAFLAFGDLDLAVAVEPDFVDAVRE